MPIRFVTVFAAIMSAVLFCHGEGRETLQSGGRSWGKTSLGLRCSLAVEKMPLSKGSPFAVSVVLENISAAKVDLKAISSFRLTEASKGGAPATADSNAHWCPVDFAGTDSQNKSGLAIEKGGSLRLSMDLAKHGWDKVTSSFWPVRDFYNVVDPGDYRLRLDIQVGAGADLKWIRSNETNVVVKK